MIFHTFYGKFTISWYVAWTVLNSDKTDIFIIKSIAYMGDVFELI